jgi:hypothetical protein
VPEAEVVQVDALESQQREEQPPLPSGDPTAQAACIRGIHVEERDRVDLDVRVTTDAVRVGMVAAVLGVPP